MNVAAATDDRVLKLERRLKAKPDRVFAAWIEPEQIAKWFGPGEMKVPRHEIDARVGGAWTVTMRGPKGNEMTVGGVYREIDPPRRLVFTWAWLADGQRGHEPGHETEVAVDFSADGNGTLLKLTQRTFATADERDKHNMGWSASLEGLARLVEA